MFIVPLFAAVLCILVGFGYVVSRAFLCERSTAAVYGMSAVLGPATFMVTVNALAYVLPLVCAAAASLLLMVAGTTVGIFVWKRAEPIVPPRSVLWAMWALIAVAGFTFMRIPPSDVLHWSQAPTIATMVEGNFPVMQPTNPAHAAKYHYGPELFVASLQLLTGSSIEMGYAIQPLLGIAGLLFAVLALVYVLTNSWRAASLASILALCGGGLAWIHVGFVQDLYTYFVQGNASVAPFRALWEMYKTPAANPLLVIFMHRSSAMGFPLFYVLLYALYHVIHVHSSMKWRWMIVSAVLALGLSLTMEIGFVVVCIALLLYLIMRMNRHGKAGDWMPILSAGVLVLFPVLLIALVQGGMLTRVGPGESLGTFHLAFTGFIHPTFGVPISLWSWTVIGSFGCALFLLPFTLFLFYKKHLPSWLCMIALCGLVQFIVPIILQFSPRPGEIIRLWWGATSLFALLAGVFISVVFLESNRFIIKMSSYCLVACMLVSSGIFLLMNLVFPTRHIELAPVFAHLPQMTIEEQEFYKWIQTNTSLTDYFYTTATNDGDDSFEQGLFIQRSGRFSVGHTLGDTLQEDDPSLMRIAQHCDPQAFNALNIRYLAITTHKRAEWFKNTCAVDDWNSVYGKNAEDLRIYELVSQ